MKQSVAFIGAGNLASALAPALAAAGYPIAALASRNRSSAEALAARLPGAAVFDTPGGAAALAGMVFITTADNAIEQVADAVDWRPDQVAIHCSGTYGPELLRTAAAAGAATGVLHPLQSFPDRDGSPEKLRGAWAGVQGDPRCLGLFEDLAAD